MARTTPARTENFARSPGERRVYDALMTLPDRMIVLHSKRWSGEHPSERAEGEADFVIIDPDAGVLALEVKGGAIRCQQGIWNQKLAGEPGWKDIDPYAQASASLHVLRRRLTTGADAAEVLFGHAVWFPDADTTGTATPFEAPAALTLDQRHLANPELALKGVFDHWRSRFPRKTGGGPAKAEAMFDLLAPSFEWRVVAVEDAARASAPISAVSRSNLAAPALTTAWRPAVDWMGDVLLTASEWVMLAPIRFVMLVVDIAARLMSGLFRWCWDHFKTGLTLGFAGGLLVGVVALALRLGFHKVGATPWIYGGFAGSFLAFAAHELCVRVEKSAVELASGARSRWDAFRTSF